MALAEFWENVRARNPLFHEGVSPPDVPRVTAEELDVALTGRQTWPTLGVLKGFDEKEFDFLPNADRARLTDLVCAFNATASELRELWYRFRSDADAEALFAERVPVARSRLRDIILQLEQDRYRSPDALRFGKQVELEVGDLRPDVVDLRFHVGPDWSGDPGFSAWAILSEEATATDEKLFAVSRRVRPLIEDAMYRVAKGHYAYLSFRGVGEKIHEDEDEEVAA